MVKAIVIRQTGGPEVLRLEDVEIGAPGPGEVRIRQTAIGVNFIDTYYRSGLYPAPGGLPFIAGAEAAGIGVARAGAHPRRAAFGRKGAAPRDDLRRARRDRT